jgi:citrate synthase
MMLMNGQEYLTSEETCNLLGVKAATLYTYVSRGVLASYRQGMKRQRLYKRSQVEGLLELKPSGASEGLPTADAAVSVLEGPDVPLAERVPLSESWIPYI